MSRNICDYSRREFLRRGAILTAGSPWIMSAFGDAALPTPSAANAKVALVGCKGYAPADVKAAFDQCFDLIGGLAPLVRGKTVAVKLNLTGTDFSPYLGRPVGESYMTHQATVVALFTALFAAGATRVRALESTQRMTPLQESLVTAGWDVRALSSLGRVEYENTRNLGQGKNYSRLNVPNGGLMFTSLDLNHSYHDTDVMISMAKMKRHLTAGVTLSMKNMFGVTPNSLYGEEAGNEDATAGRGPLHSPDGFDKIVLPGLKPGVTARSPLVRVPRIIVDICAARPVDLAIVDGISSMTGGEGPWCAQGAVIKLITPGVLVVGRNPVSTDAVAVAVMGYDPRSPKGTKPFEQCENHLLLAEQAGLGTADLSKIDVRGLTVEKARCPYG